MKHSFQINVRHEIERAPFIHSRMRWLSVRQQYWRAIATK